MIIYCKSSCFHPKEDLRLLFRQHTKISANYTINYGGASSQTQLQNTMELLGKRIWRTSMSIVQRKETERENF